MDAGQAVGGEGDRRRCRTDAQRPVTRTKTAGGQRRRCGVFGSPLRHNIRRREGREGEGGGADFLPAARRAGCRGQEVVLTDSCMHMGRISDADRFVQEDKWPHFAQAPDGGSAQSWSWPGNSGVPGIPFICQKVTLPDARVTHCSSVTTIRHRASSVPPQACADCSLHIPLTLPRARPSDLCAVQIKTLLYGGCATNNPTTISVVSSCSYLVVTYFLHRSQ